MTMFYSCLILFGWFSVESISNLSTIYKYLRNLEDYIYIYIIHTSYIIYVCTKSSQEFSRSAANWPLRHRRLLEHKAAWNLLRTSQDVAFVCESSTQCRATSAVPPLPYHPVSKSAPKLTCHRYSPIIARSRNSVHSTPTADGSNAADER